MSKYIIKKHNQGFSIYKKRWLLKDKIHIRVVHSSEQNDTQFYTGSCLFLKDFSTLDKAKEYKKNILDAEWIPRHRGYPITRYMFEGCVYYGHSCKRLRYAGDWEHFQVYHNLEGAKLGIDKILDYDKRGVIKTYGC